jgi:Domain of unknown function (DUF1906)
MTIISQTAFVRALGIDTISTITTAQAMAFQQAGFSFAVRYVESLSTTEISAILGAGLALMPVAYSRAGGWMPTAALGTQDGNNMISDLNALSLPKGITVWCDLEGMGGVAADTIAYTEAWGACIEAAGYIPGVYVGAGITLNSAQLYALNNIHAYWHSCSVVPDVDGCSYMMIQLNPPDQVICEVEVDINVIQKDHAGRFPIWAIQSAA